MKMGVFAVYDAAVKAYLQPIFSPTKAAAVRSFQDAVAQENSQFAKHAADYTLFQLGGFDDGTGELASLQVPEKVITALECVDDALFPQSSRVA